MPAPPERSVQCVRTVYETISVCIQGGSHFNAIGTWSTRSELLVLSTVFGRSEPGGSSNGTIEMVEVARATRGVLAGEQLAVFNEQWHLGLAQGGKTKTGGHVG